MRPRTIVLLALLASAQAHAQTPPGGTFTKEVDRQSQIYGSRGEDVPEGYVIGRSLLSYTFVLPAEFKSALGKLGPEDRWLDIGAGEGRAVIDYVTSRYDSVLGNSGRRKAKAVAISIEDRRTKQWHDAVTGAEDKQMQYFFGRRLREYSREELGGEFQVITDVMGAFSYTRFVSTFIEKTLALLAPNGTFYSVLQDVRTDEKSRPHYAGASFLTEIRKPDGAEMKVCDWLKTVSCVEVTCEAKPQFSPPIEVYRVRKVCADVKVPALELAHFNAGTPPERKFRVKAQ